MTFIVAVFECLWMARL